VRSSGCCDPACLFCCVLKCLGHLVGVVGVQQDLLCPKDREPDGAVVQVHGYIDFCVVAGCVPDVVQAWFACERAHAPMLHSGASYWPGRLWMRSRRSSSRWEPLRFKTSVRWRNVVWVTPRV